VEAAGQLLLLDLQAERLAESSPADPEFAAELPGQPQERDPIAVIDLALNGLEVVLLGEDQHLAAPALREGPQLAGLAGDRLVKGVDVVR
jgi:hypothetical protein